MNELLPRNDRSVLCRMPWRLAVAVALGAMAGPVLAQATAQPVIYPAKGQSAKQQDQDRYECHSWAREQSGGYDPTQPMAAAPPPPTAQAATGSTSKGAPVSGMAAGAMGGAAVAELTNHNAGHGAAAGALGGAVIQRMKQNQATQKQQAQAQGAQQQAMQQQAAARSQQRATYERALGACMEGRGYTVK
jgi:hypothetical protein